jgi:hypothetical protein
MMIARMCVRLLVLSVAGAGLAACAGLSAPPAPGAGASQLSPLYDVPPDLMRPDGTMINGLQPINPDDQS